MLSSTRLYASRRAWNDRAKRASIDRLAMLLGSVLEARRRVMLEVNVGDAALESVIAVLPCMREPTVSTLHGDAGYAVKAAVPRADLPTAPTLSSPNSRRSSHEHIVLFIRRHTP
jgi:ATP phosphoribosyltransferase-like protein